VYTLGNSRGQGSSWSWRVGAQEADALAAGFGAADFWRLLVSAVSAVVPLDLDHDHIPGTARAGFARLLRGRTDRSISGPHDRRTLQHPSSRWTRCPSGCPRTRHPARPGHSRARSLTASRRHCSRWCPDITSIRETPPPKGWSSPVVGDERELAVVLQDRDLHIGEIADALGSRRFQYVVGRHALIRMAGSTISPSSTTTTGTPSRTGRLRCHRKTTYDCVRMRSVMVPIASTAAVSEVSPCGDALLHQGHR